MFLEHSNFPVFSLLESCSQTNKFPKNSLHSDISIIYVNVLILHFASLLDVLFLQCGLEKHTLQAVSFRIARRISHSRLAKALKLISLCNLHPRTKDCAGVFLTNVFLLKQPILVSTRQRDKSSSQTEIFVQSNNSWKASPPKSDSNEIKSIK